MASGRWLRKPNCAERNPVELSTPLFHHKTEEHISTRDDVRVTWPPWAFLAYTYPAFPFLADALLD